MCIRPTDIESPASLKLYSVRFLRITPTSEWSGYGKQNYNWHEYWLEGANSYREYRSQLLEAP